MDNHRVIHPFALVPSDLAAGSTLTVLDFGGINAINQFDPCYLFFRATGGGWVTNTSSADRTAMIRVREFDASGNEFRKYFPMPGNAVGTFTVPLINNVGSSRCVVDIVADAGSSAKSSANANQCKLIGAVRSGYVPERFHIQCRFVTTATTGGNGRYIGGVGLPAGTSGVASGACLAASIALDTTASGGNLNMNCVSTGGHTAYGLDGWDLESDATGTSAGTAAISTATVNITNAPIDLGFILSATETSVKCGISFDLYGGGA